MAAMISGLGGSEGSTEFLGPVRQEGEGGLDCVLTRGFPHDSAEE